MFRGEMTKTGRGFEKVIFRDTAGLDFSVQQSSAVGDYDDSISRPGTSFLWLGSENGSRMHINREQVEWLTKSMNHWLQTGSLNAPE